MRTLRKLVHSPHHLFVFEVCGRLLSFTSAARELGVTQPAVSLAIRQMEQAIGFKLFNRHHRRIELTTAGSAMHAEVSASLHRIQQTASRLARQAEPSTVTLAVSTAFADYWFIPRLSRLHQLHPRIDLRLQVVDQDVELEDKNLSLGIRRGQGHWPGYSSAPIAAEEILAVASAAYLARSQIPTEVDAIKCKELIHLEEPFRPRPTWQEWFGALGCEYRERGEGLRLNDYALVIQAAMSGEGIALGWRHIVAPLLERGLLVDVCEKSWSTGEAFYLIWSDKTELTPAAARVRDWVLVEANTRGLIP